jgi:predicted HicB family RNase H-like nuclease
MSKTKRKTTSIKIDPELWKQAKIEAIKRDSDLSELVELALKKELNLTVK